MLCKTFIVIFGFFTLSSAHTENTTFTPLENATQSSIFPSLDYIPIFSLQYDIIEDKISHLTFELLIQERFYFEVRTEDVLNLLESQSLVIPPKLIDIDYKRIIQITDIKIMDILQVLTQHVPAKKLPNIKQILTGFNIGFDTYQEYFMEVDNDNIYKLIASGNYTEATIENALKIMKKTEQQIVDIIKDILLDDLSEVPVSTLLSHFDEQLEDLLCKRGIPASDIFKYSSLRDMLDNFRAALRNQTFWTTAVSANSLVSVLEAFQNIQQYRFFVIGNLTNMKSGTIQTVDNITLNSTFSLITIPQNLEAYFDIEYNPTKSNGCYYFVSDDQEVSIIAVENITLKKNVIFTENNGTLHELGLPLICQGRLHGILVKQDEARLAFLTFSKTEVPVPVDIPTWSDEVIEGGSAQNLGINALLIMGICASLINPTSII